MYVLAVDLHGQLCVGDAVDADVLIASVEVHAIEARVVIGKPLIRGVHVEHVVAKPRGGVQLVADDRFAIGLVEKLDIQIGT
jgi:hypothetical protein